MELSGYFLWEGFTFLLQILFAMSLLVLRRKASGRPTFTDADRQLFFARPRVKRSTPKFWIHFGIAAFLCFCAGLLELLILGPFGVSALGTAQLITYMGIVKMLLC